MLIDLGLGVARDYGLVFTVPGDVRRIYLDTFELDLGRLNGDESWELPVPATFIIEPGGTVVYASADPDYTTRPEPSEVLAAIPDAPA